MSARIVMKLTVVEAIATTPEVVRLTLVHPRRPQLPAWEPGAHVDLRLPDERVRQYSLCGDPADRSRYVLAIKREEAGRGGSAWAHAHLGAGASVPISHPRNHFLLTAGARHHVLIGGGIGVTPVAAMARHLAATGGNFTLHLCARSAAQAPLLEELRAVCGERLRCWFSAEGERLDPATLGPPEDGVHLYACGPQSLTAAVQALGWPADQVHVEHFAPLVVEGFVPEPFDVQIASTGATLHVPAETSLLEVLRQNGVNMPSSCEIGVCGACECGYREGDVIHRDVVLPQARRRDHLMPCVSRASGTLTLAL
ncbi:PDR/VanB family oxidoreductase [Methylobacterium fujisawaense]|uniref:Vanillate O-demethylase ferredoxin subunit n=1 Tax=Methylobacterium fujisawaense TaxID=107400 RepID=A0ABR6DLI1_9HYPH|nr:PDR/VanB family oxidoreductase [Methylobacterium fujisawaense]MBA9066159.1 vanillate O-demethylase ferredoxin subunit [Methylobacterium fujisawaense]MDH3032076.1 PDR/VanB family oxidoreductase [Methylobacterium fujisawaense]